ncbi:hypothetical protein B0H14DRAFT_2572770 [Mycena olivaceomarginata]|nr:hypothetical protein B0H14DRAFT_2572770 [Mycena olivaceomarginata]
MSVQVSGVQSGVYPAHTGDGVLRVYSTQSGCSAERGRGGVGGCRPTSALTGKGGWGISATKMDGWSASEGHIWGSRLGMLHGVNEPGKASMGSGALQMIAGTLWGAVGSTQWQREQDASEVVEETGWIRTACEQGCMRQAERIQPRDACIAGREEAVAHEVSKKELKKGWAAQGAIKFFGGCSYNTGESAAMRMAQSGRSSEQDEKWREG